MRQREKRREKGQSLVELAISFPILLLILSGLLDIGRVYYTYIAIEDAAAEGALYLALNPDCRFATDDNVFTSSPDNTKCNDPNNAIYRARHASTNQQLDWTLATWTPWRPAGAYDVGDVVRMTVQYPFRFVTPGISAITESITLEVTASHLIIDKK